MGVPFAGGGFGAHNARFAEDDSIVECCEQIRFMPQTACLQRFILVPYRYKDQSLEQLFRAECYSELEQSCRRVALLVLCVIQILMFSYLVFWFKFEDPSAHDQITLVMWGLSTLLGLARKQISKCAETTVCLIYPIALLAAFASSRYRQAFWLGEHGDGKEVLWSINYSDALQVNLACMVSVGVFTMRLRSILCLAMVFAAPAVYLACTLPLPIGYEGTLVPRLLVAFVLAGVNILLLAGRCNTETLERTEFLRLHSMHSRLVQEKILRCSAEFSAEQASELVSVPSREEEELTSTQPESNLSSAVFCSQLGDFDLQLRAMKVVAAREQWLILPWQITCCFEEVLGAGGFGSVFRGTYLGFPAAMKVSTDQVNADNHCIAARELRMLRHVRHVNLVSFYGACILEKNKEIILVEELIQGSTLRSVVKQKNVDEQQRQHMLLGICSGLAHLHRHRPPIVHSDLKPGNIMVETPFYTARIIDLGLSKYQSSKRFGRAGTLRWQAPETLGLHTPQTASDIFSYGLILFYVMTGRKPYESLPTLEPRELIRACLTGVAIPPLPWQELPLSLQEKCWAACKKCLEVDESDRANAVELLHSISTWFPSEQAAHHQTAQRALEDGLANLRSRSSTTDDCRDKGPAKQILGLTTL